MVLIITQKFDSENASESFCLTKIRKTKKSLILHLCKPYMLKKTNLLFLITALLVFSNCKDSDDSKLFRMYAEGKITSNGSPVLSELIHLKNNGRIIGETLPKNNGQFVVAGPYESGDTELTFLYKIESFTTKNKDCKLSSDSLKVIIPAGVTYVLFDEIKFK